MLLIITITLFKIELFFVVYFIGAKQTRPSIAMGTVDV